MPLLDARDVRVTLGGAAVLRGVSFALDAGTWTGLVGPNGSGKTTLLRAVSGVQACEGRLVFDGRPVRDWPARALARRLAMVRQTPTLAFDLTVRDLVLLGRSPHTGWLGGYGPADHARARAALDRVGLRDAAGRSARTLSGGERQRAFLAQALAQDPDLLLLDEPTTHLDVRYAHLLLAAVEGRVRAGGTALAVFHDLEQAARWCDRLLLLSGGRLVADGPPAAVLTPAHLAAVYGMEAAVETDADGRLRVTYRRPVAPGAAQGGSSE
jgi:iron complex transport system ATP-binding protein